MNKRERMKREGVDYLEGFLLMRQGPLDLSFYPQSDQPKITSLVTQSGIVYSIEIAKYYDHATETTVKKVRVYDPLLLALLFFGHLLTLNNEYVLTSKLCL